MLEVEIDVLIPVFNGASTIRVAIESILNQSVQNIRAHIIDDGSTDDTPKILAEIADSDSRVVIHSKSNSGIVDALNFGLTFCGAKYIARHDADDIAYTKRFQVQSQYLDQHPDCVAVGGSVHHIDVNGMATGTDSVLHPPSNSNPYSYPAKEPYIVHPFLMVRRDAVRAVGGYRHTCHCEDSDLYWRLQHMGYLHNISDYLGEYRIHDESISGASVKNGRLMAVFSQLAAISEQRRRSGANDVVFKKSLVVEAKSIPLLVELVQYCAMKLTLTQHEWEYLELASCVKLLELTSYRPYDLELSDCKCINAAIRQHGKSLDPESNRIVSRQLSGTAANLIMRQKYLAAWALLSRSYYCSFLYRLALRLLLAPTFRRRIRAMTGRVDPAK